eukprot:Gb_13816 [translate_table: standard]
MSFYWLTFLLKKSAVLSNIKIRLNAIHKRRFGREVASMADNTATFLDVLLAIILPPLGVFFKHGCRVEFWICLLLTLLGYVPGIIYAIYAITVVE